MVNHPTTVLFATAAVAAQLLMVEGHPNISVPPSSLPRVPVHRGYGRQSSIINGNRIMNARDLISNIRGGGSGSTKKSKTRSKRQSTKRRSSRSADKKVRNEIHEIPREDHAVANINHDEPGIQVQSVLIPRQTSFMTPLRFLSFLLINASFNSCMQTSGKPLEDAVRRILGMPSPPADGDDGSFASKVTPLHLYVARKMRSEMLPPGHLPSPLPLLGLFLSAILYAGGTVLLPKWNVAVDIFLNYVRFDIHGERSSIIYDASHELQNWFAVNNDDDIDPFYASSKKQSTPSVLISETDTQKTVVCPLCYSPGYDENADEADEHRHLRHPRRYYFELDQKRYYYDPAYAGANDNTQSPAVVSGGPSLDEVAPLSLLSESYTRGLNSNAQLDYAKERYSPYSDITIPVPTLQSAFTQRITSPLVSLQLIGRLLSLLEEENIGRAFTNLLRLGFEHFIDAKRSVASAITLAEEVQGIDKGKGDADESRFWALRPKESSADGEKSDWLRVSPKDLLPGDIFVIAPTESASRTSNSLTVPVDALLLEGTCVTEEAALTGESVPQAKVPLDFASDETRDDDVGDSSPNLDMTGYHRSSCVFAGTQLLHSSNWDEGADSSSSILSNLPSLPGDTFKNETLPAMFLTLSTGSYSSRGEIIQSLLKSRMNTGISSRESEQNSVRLIGVLAVFAVGACIFLLLDNGDGRQKDSVFKRIVQCTRIAVASVPSDLPASLAACAYQCANILREESDAVNSETGALLESSKVDTVVFDKTGTLTADTQALTSIVHAPRRPNMKDSPKFLSDIVLAGGHTLIGMGNDESDLNLVGDPVDLASLSYTKWKYNTHDKSASSPKNTTKLWQIRSFPFDPISKTSSAIVLVQKKDSTYQLMVAIKGSPNKIRNLIENEEEGLTHRWFDKTVKRLGKLGYRSIGLAAMDVSDSKASDILFPSGLPKSNDTNARDALIHAARSHARTSLVRGDIEKQTTMILDMKDMTFVGFACFNAPMRSSTPRVVNELRRTTDLIMLTGDEPYASLAIANQAGITNGKKSKICLLKTDDSGLVWEVNKKARKFTLERAQRLGQDAEKGQAVLIISGDAISALLTGPVIDETIRYVREAILPRTSVIASASPNDKCLFVRWLKDSCKKDVLMCGDGVNDIAAMREATVSVAMLSGFGHESEGVDTNDADDLRRKEKLKRRSIGSNRLKTVPSLDQAGVGDSFVASVARVQRNITKGVQQLQNGYEGTPQHITAYDVCIASIQGEIKRHRDLKKGGSKAAKLLAEEDSLRKSLQSRASVGDAPVDVDDIQTGESCLASSFTLLRPCVSGVESILRTGVSAAACGISLYRKVALSCMLSCYNLATLYRNGISYGKWMWQVELSALLYADRASFAASSTPRPRLVAGVRPSATPFHVSEVLSTILQAIIHIVTLTFAVDAGRQLEVKYPSQSSHKGFGIQWNDQNNNKSASAGSVLASLVKSSTSNPLHSDSDTPNKSFFRRPPFQPNHISNSVFVVSIFQNAVTNLVNHNGRPFSVSFLESRQLCLSVSLAFLLCIVCIAESIPMLNTFIQLAPYPTKASKIAMLRLLLLNVSLSYFAEYFSTFFFRHDIWKERNKPISANPEDEGEHSPLCAADIEEKLLSEERQQNRVIVSLVCFLMFYFSIQIMKR